MALDDYGALIASARNAAPDYATQQAQQQALKLRQAELRQQTQAAQAQIDEQKGWQSDLSTVLANPTAEGYAALIARHPKFADQAKKSWEVLDESRRTSDLQTGAEIYSAAASGKYDLAATLMERRIAADKAAGQPDDPTDAAILEALRNGSDVEKKAAMGMIGISLSAVTGPDKFASTLGELTKGDRGYTLDAGATRFDGNNQIVAQSPFLKTADGRIAERIVEGGGQASGQGGSGSPTGPTRTDLPAPQAAVASVLSTALPSVVVSGILGNFDVEGGYGGAKGDGGTAHGIAQWRGDRLENFKRVMGKTPGQASHEEQARFVLHELQNPEQAGMTVEQRDAILAAKSPQQAATLFDQFYERSDGKHRDRRVAAAVGYHSGGAAPSASDGGDPAPKGYRWLTPPKQKDAPSGFRYTANGDLEAIPGGPADSKDKPRRMTPQEVQAEGLNPNVVYYRNKDGVPQAVSGQDTRTTAARPIPQAVENKAKPLIDARDSFQRLLGTWKKEYGGYTVTGGVSNWLQGKLGTGPKGQRDWWADFKSMDNQIRNDLFGSALTATEKAAYEATTIDPSMNPDQIKKNLTRRRKIVEQAVARTKNYLIKNRFDPEAVDALFAPLGGGDTPAAPVRVRSIQEAKKLAPGTLFVTPDGRTMRKR